MASDGRCSLKLMTGSGTTKQTIEISPHTDYVLSCWVNNAEVTANNIYLDTDDVFDAPDQMPGGHAQMRIQPGDALDWTFFTGTFNSGSKQSVTLRIFGPSMVGAAYFDRISLVPMDKASVRK